LKTAKYAAIRWNLSWNLKTNN